MGSRRRQGVNRLAGNLKKNIYVVLAVLAISGAAGFIAPFYISHALYGVPWTRRGDTVVTASGEGGPQATPTWARPSLPQIRFNFWVTSTSSLAPVLSDPATATPTRTATLLPTRTKNEPAATDTSRPPTRTKKPQDPTSTPRPPRPTNTQAPTRKPTLPPPSDTPAPAPTAAALPTESPSVSSYAAMTPTPQQLQGPAVGSPHPFLLHGLIGSLWSLLARWWN